MSVFITSTGHFLPGVPIENDQIEDVLGYVGGRPSRLKKRILEANGIETRHYAIDKDHTTTITNSEMAARAGQDCLDQSYLAKQQIKMLSCATSQGDVVLPGFGSMVQADLDLSDIELQTSHGICSSSMMALKAAYTNLKAGEHDNALVIASELTSRLFKASRYEAAGVDKKLSNRLHLRSHRSGREMTLLNISLHLTQRDLLQQSLIRCSPMDGCTIDV